MGAHCVSAQVHVKQEQKSKNLLGKLGTKTSKLPDIEDCSKSPSLQTSQMSV